jgi:hypothetical protein
MADEQVIRQAFQVAYVSDNADDHTMDVEALGPVLVSFGKLLKAANAEFNQDRASIRVVVSSEFEHKCFNINFEAIQTIWEQLRDFLSDKERVENLTNLLKQLGIVGGTVGTSVLGYLKWKKGRKVESVQVVANSPDSRIVNVKGDNNTTIIVSNSVFRLAENKDILEAVEGALRPVQEGKEATKVEFRQNDVATTVLETPEVKDIILSCETPIEGVVVEALEEGPEVITATLYAHGPVFDSKAPRWRFLYRRKPIYADIRDTSIARDAVRRGGSFMNDRYKVKMEVMPPDKEDGTPHYKILEVLDFTPADKQIPLPLKKTARSPKKKR